ncbi:hypothetical protein pb186bvf_007681 [Paramecium bursaria]
MNYYEQRQEGCEVLQQSHQYQLYFVLRIIVLSLAFACSSLIFIACFQSKQRSKFPFRLLMTQCFAECIDLAGALVMSNQSYCHPQICSIVALVMHSSWITSFICSFLIIYLYYMTIKLEKSQLDWWQHLIEEKFLVFLLIVYGFPYLILLTPYILDIFGPTGWLLYDQFEEDGSNSKFFIFCGFLTERFLYNKNENEENNIKYTLCFIFFWVIPLSIIFSLILYIKCKSQRVTDSYTVAGSTNKNLDFIKKIQTIPTVYIFSWGLNFGVRFVDFIVRGEQNFTNIYLYVLYVTLNLGFELHICYVFRIFYKQYGKILNLKDLWISFFCCQGQTPNNKLQDSMDELVVGISDDD